MRAALAAKPDALLTSIVDNKAFDDIIKEARDAGVIVIAVNVDDTEGAKGNARQAFIGQGFMPAGYSLGKAISEDFPKDGPIKVLVGISAPGQNWSESRGAGVMKFLEEYKAANAGREVSWERIDSGTDLAVTSDRVGAYLNAHPDTTAYFDTGFWCAGVARALADRGVEPGKVLMGGFDLVPEVLQQMEKGYVQALVDQQPYMQGFMPVMEVYLARPWVWRRPTSTPARASCARTRSTAIMDLSAQGHALSRQLLPVLTGRRCRGNEGRPNLRAGAALFRPDPSRRRRSPLATTFGGTR